MRPRRGATGLIAVGLVAFATVAILVFTLGGEGYADNGPLYSPDGDEATLTIHPGGHMTWGQPIYFNRSGSAIELVSARPASIDRGLRILGVQAASRERQGAVGVVAGYPAEGITGRPVSEVRVAPESSPEGKDGVEFLVGLTADKPGRYVVRGLEVTYEQDGARFRETMPDSLSVCVVPRSASITAEDCAFPGSPPGKVG